jgi:transposase
MTVKSRDIRFAYPSAPRTQLLLYRVSVDEMVAQDDPVRALAALLDEVDWTPWEEAYTGYGQPAIYPKYMAGALLLGLLYKVRSTRELERAARKHLDFIWLLEGFTPDHSTFALFQKRHAQAIVELNRHLARKLVATREKALLQLIIDGTRIQADSARQGARTAQFIEMAIAELERRLEQLRQDSQPVAVQTGYLDGVVAPGDEPTCVAQLDKEIVQLQAKRDKYQRALDIAQQRDVRAKEHNGKKAEPVRVPITDPESQIIPNKDGGCAPNFTPVAMVEQQTGAIVFNDVLPGSDEAKSVMPAVSASAALIGETPDALLADSNFASGEVLQALHDASIDAYMPTRSLSPPDNPALRPDPSVPVAEQDRARLPRKGGKFARTAFVYEATADAYHCPMGHALTPYKQGKDGRGADCVYYQCAQCPTCPLVADCIKGKAEYRTITRDEYEPLREAAAERLNSDEGKAIYKRRAPGIESVFGILKRVFGIRRFRLRGLANVRMEWLWICTAYNLKKLLKLANDPDAKRGPTPPKGPGMPDLSPIAAYNPLKSLRHLLWRGAKAFRVYRGLRYPQGVAA